MKIKPTKTETRTANKQNIWQNGGFRAKLNIWFSKKV